MITKKEQDRKNLWLETFGGFQTRGGDTNIIYWETYGDDLEYIKGIDQRYVWTIIEEDGDCILTPGIRFVNRLHYVLAVKPYTPEQYDEWQHLVYTRY